jgi:hypothetical protein
MAELTAPTPTPTEYPILTGSLVTFGLLDVLALLGHGTKRAVLSLEAPGAHLELFIDDGDLVGLTGDGALDVNLFWAAVADQGSFAAFATEYPLPAASRVGLGPLLGELAPMVDEFAALCGRLPLRTVVRMAPSTDAAEIRIRSDQWQVLSAVGTGGTTVGAALRATGQHPLAAMRTMCQMVEVRLIGRELAVLPALDPVAVPALAAARDGVGDAALRPATPPAGAPRTDGPAKKARSGPRRPPPPAELAHQGTLMPPPVAGEPWRAALGGDPASGGR